MSKWKAKWENNTEREDAYSIPGVSEVIFHNEWGNTLPYDRWATLPNGNVPTIVYHKGYHKPLWIWTLCEYYLYLLKNFLKIRR